MCCRVFSPTWRSVNLSACRKSDAEIIIISSFVDNLQHLIAMINYHVNFSYCIPSEFGQVNSINLFLQYCVGCFICFVETHSDNYVIIPAYGLTKQAQMAWHPIVFERLWRRRGRFPCFIIQLIYRLMIYQAILIPFNNQRYSYY